MNIRKASNSTAIGIAILVVVLVLSPIIIFLVRNAAATIQVTFESNEQIRQQKKAVSFVFENQLTFQSSDHPTACPVPFPPPHRLIFNFSCTRVTCPKRPKNWNGKSGKATRYCFRCCHQVSPHSSNKCKRLIVLKHFILEILLIKWLQRMSCQQVPAEFYEDVTVYFSDIVGFTEIAAECSPLEVR